MCTKGTYGIHIRIVTIQYGIIRIWKSAVTKQATGHLFGNASSINKLWYGCSASPCVIRNCILGVQRALTTFAVATQKTDQCTAIGGCLGLLTKNAYLLKQLWGCFKFLIETASLMNSE